MVDACMFELDAIVHEQSDWHFRTISAPLAELAATGQTRHGNSSTVLTILYRGHHEKFWRKHATSYGWTWSA